jgi:hypothetical protein
MRSLPPREIPLGEVRIGEVAEGDVLPEGEVVGAGKGEAGFDFFGEGAEVAVVEGDSVPAADDGVSWRGGEALFPHGSVGHAEGADELGLDDFPGVGGGSEEVEAVECGDGGCSGGGGRGRHVQAPFLRAS